MKIIRILFIGLGLVALLLFVRLWAGAGSYPEIWDLQYQIEQQTQLNAEQQARNDHLSAELADIARDDATIEDHARSELGMLKKSEVYYQVIFKDDPKEQAAAASPQVAPPKHVE